MKTIKKTKKKPKAKKTIKPKTKRKYKDRFVVTILDKETGVKVKIKAKTLNYEINRSCIPVFFTGHSSPMGFDAGPSTLDLHADISEV
jgi:hypothetical protein